jgi:hypothetical protein
VEEPASTQVVEEPAATQLDELLPTEPKGGNPIDEVHGSALDARIDLTAHNRLHLSLGSSILANSELSVDTPQDEITEAVVEDDSEQKVNHDISLMISNEVWDKYMKAALEDDAKEGPDAMIGDQKPVKVDEHLQTPLSH